MSYSFEIKGIDKLAKKYAKSEEVIRGAEEEMLKLGTAIARGVAIEEAPVDSSRLRRSIRTKVRVPFGYVRAFAPYAVYQEYGTGVHVGRGMIRPKRARVLAWQRPKGTWHYAKQVRGVKGRFYMKKGLIAVQNKVDMIKQVGLDYILKRL